jgi:hypothetical protein
VLASAIGPVGSVVVGGVGTIVSVVAIARVWPEIRELKTLEESEPAESPLLA